MLNDHDGSRSHRNGLIMALGKDDWYDQKLDETQLSFLNNEAQSILLEVRKDFTNTDYYDM
jgi:hypothetical protein